MGAIVVLWIFIFVSLLGLIIYYAATGKLKQQKTDWNKANETLYDAVDVLKEMSHKKDNIDHCPFCGSHDIKIYREGYNYTKGFWLRAFDVKGGGYVAGMNSNRARCRCMNCGKDWKTDYDYRLIDKK